MPISPTPRPPPARRRWLAALLTCGVLSFCTTTQLARAAEQGEEPSDADRAAAQVLFDQGREAMGEDNYDEACSKFAESMRLDRAIGTQLNLGNCYEKLGKLASAWINFEEARSRASKQGQQQRAEIAAERAQALVGRLSKMKIHIDEPVDGMVVKRDGESLGKAQWDLPLPIDGGKHVIEASAPGKLPWKKVTKAEAEGDLVEISVPALADAPIVDDPPPPPSAQEDDGTGMLVGAIVAGSVGLIGIGVGSAFGVLAMSKNDESLQSCPDDPNLCTAEGVDARSSAMTMAHVSTTGFVVGGVGLALGVVLLVLAPSSSEEDGDTVDGDTADSASTHFTPWLDSERREGGLMWSTHW